MEGDCSEISVPTGSVAEQQAALIADLKQRSRKELKKLFWSLPVPSVSEIHGEYAGILLNQGNRVTSALTRFFVNKEGFWLGKAFEPMSDSKGRGYNIFRTRKGIRRSLRMHTHHREIETEIDPEKDSETHRLTIEYGEVNDGLVGSIVDELRRVAPGLFLGIGEVAFGGRVLPRISRKVMFAMVGPVGEFREEAADKDVVFPTESFRRVAA